MFILIYDYDFLPTNTPSLSSVFSGTQKIKWLGHVAIARWDEKELMGWKYLGTPLSVKKMKNDEDLDLTSPIREVLRNEDHVKVISSLKPPDK